MESTGHPGQRVISSSGLDVPIDSELADPKRFDYIVVIGGLLDSIEAVPKTYPAFLHQAAAAQVPLIGLCTGSFVLARHGLMEGERRVSTPIMATTGSDCFPRCVLSSTEIF